MAAHSLKNFISDSVGYFEILHGLAPLYTSQVSFLQLHPSNERLSCCLKSHSSDLEEREPCFYCFSSKNVEQTLHQHQNSWVRASFKAFKKPPVQTWIWRISSEVCPNFLMLLSVLSFLYELFLLILWWSIFLFQFNSIQFYLYSAKLQQLSSQGT